jgi:hypothetical protein
MFTASLRALRLISLLAAELTAFIALVGIGRRPEFEVPTSDIERWLHEAPPGDVVIALLRWVALAGAAWLSLTTVLALVAAATRVPAAARVTRWTTLPVIRRAVDAAFAVSVATSAVLAPGSASARPVEPPATALVRDGRTATITELPPDTAPAPAALPSTPAAPASVEPGLVEPGLVEVAPGDNLWELAARRVAASSGRTRDTVTDAEIAPYWARLCDRNLDGLVSGDPDLVYPGERIAYPPMS